MTNIGIYNGFETVPVPSSFGNARANKNRKPASLRATKLKRITTQQKELRQFFLTQKELRQFYLTQKELRWRAKKNCDHHGAKSRFRDKKYTLKVTTTMLSPIIDSISYQL